MTRLSAPSPSWDRLFEIAQGQEGLLTTLQAHSAGYSDPLLSHYVRVGRLLRVRHGIYRVVHFPPGEHEDLVAVWLWSDRKAAMSHQTALALHDLSDALPSRVHVTVPESWSVRRLRVPPGVVLHFADLPASERSWFGAVPVTVPRRTLADCVVAHVSPELMEQAIGQAMARGLVAKKEADILRRALRSEAKKR